MNDTQTEPNEPTQAEELEYHRNECKRLKRQADEDATRIHGWKETAAIAAKERDQLKRELGTVLDVRDQLAAARERLTSQTKAAFREGYSIGYSHGIGDIDGDCPGEASESWAKSESIKTCPYCGSTNSEKRHADVPNNVGVETDWRQCEDCGHQWGHQ